MKRGVVIGAVAVLVVAVGVIAWLLVAGSGGPEAPASPSPAVSSTESDLTTIAQDELDAYADACTREATEVPPHCGLRVPWAADLATLDRVVFRVEQYPAIALSSDERTFSATGGVVVATAYGTTPDGAPARFTYRDDDWSLRGLVTRAGDELVLSVG